VTDPAPAIVASNLKRIDKGWLVATVDLWIPGWHMHIRGVMWGRRPNDGFESVVIPARPYTLASGEQREAKILEWGDSATAERFRVAALAAIHKLADQMAASP
jgi:hypothetical protein